MSLDVDGGGGKGFSSVLRSMTEYFDMLNSPRVVSGGAWERISDSWGRSCAGVAKLLSSLISKCGMDGEGRINEDELPSA